MTEEEWSESKKPDAMLSYLMGTPSDRKLRLFACGCCRAMWALLVAEAQVAVGTAERYADGFADEEARRKARKAAQIARGKAPKHRRIRALIRAAYETVNADPVTAAFNSSSYIAPVPEDEAVWKEQASLLRDIFGNPFLPIVFSPAWRTATALSLARTMYDSRDFSAMSILADALQDAGCDNADILNHCRDSQQTHVRGCWVVDLVLENQ